MPNIEVLELQPSSPEIKTCARWRVEASSDVLEGNAEEEDGKLIKSYVPSPSSIPKS